MMKNATFSTSRAFVATLHPAAAKFNLKPHLSDVTLANILAGDTCSPISLADFEKHLTYVEYSVENLQFVVWFQDYRQRYLKFSYPDSRSTHDDFTFNAPNRARTEQLAAETSAILELDDAPPSPVAPPQYTNIAIPPSVYTPPNTKDLDHDHFNAECQRVISTFLSPGAAKELALDAIVRDTAIRKLSLTCHPNVFLPIYEEVYNMLETYSVSRFLSVASANINLPKQIYWYIVGLLNITIGVIIAISLITMLPTPPQANRAWRIFAVGFSSLGSAQCYSAWRGYCSQVWMRGNTQLRVWEMQEMDEEARAFVDRILGPCKTHYPAKDRPEDHEDNKQGMGSVLADYPGTGRPGNITTIAPFTMEPPSRAFHSNDTIASYGLAPTPHFQRPPVFGPETVVLDPRIKAVHRQLMIEVCRFGVWFMIAFSAIIFAIPSRLRS